jgi:hypothetical protein
MARTARFFLSRIVKMGAIDSEQVCQAIRESVSITSREFAWTFVVTSEDTVTYRGTGHRYIAGQLAKYDPEAVVEVVDAATRRVILQPEPNM